MIRGSTMRFHTHFISKCGNNMAESLVIDGVYEHYKQKRYRVVAVAKHSETLEDCVVYEALYENKIARVWVRPLTMFLETVEVDGNQVPRFRLVSELKEGVSKKEIFFAGGFLYNPKTQEVLLHKRDGNTSVNPHKWGFFGGTSEGDETPIETFAREMYEELAIVIDFQSAVPLCEYLNEERGIYRYVFFVESDLPKSAMRLGEGADFDWISLEKVFAYDLTDKTALDLRTFLTRIS